MSLKCVQALLQGVEENRAESQIRSFLPEYASSSLRMASSPAISMRLFRLMQKNNVNTQKLCECIGMREKRFRAIFQGEEQLTADEIALLSGFFGVTTDYILKGESD